MSFLFGKGKDKTKGEGSLLDPLKRSVERTRSQIAARVEELVRKRKESEHIRMCESLVSD